MSNRCRPSILSAISRMFSQRLISVMAPSPCTRRFIRTQSKTSSPGFSKTGRLDGHARLQGPFVDLNSRMRKGDRNMKEKQIKLPGPDHPISIQLNPARVVVTVAGRVVADTRNALTLREAAYPPVEYI